jgi:hypothetical protein
MLLTLLGLPILGPIRSAEFLLKQVQNMAHRELYDIDNLRERLILLQGSLEQGEMSEEEFVEQEAQILELLREARRLNGGGTL